MQVDRFGPHFDFGYCSSQFHASEGRNSLNACTKQDPLYCSVKEGAQLKLQSWTDDTDDGCRTVPGLKVVKVRDSTCCGWCRGSETRCTEEG